MRKYGINASHFNDKFGIHLKQHTEIKALLSHFSDKVIKEKQQLKCIETFQ